MRRPATLILAAALVAGGSTPSWAQREVDTGSHIAVPKRAEIPEVGTDEDKNLIVMRQFARCVFARNADGVAAAVMLEPGSESAALNRLAVDDCLQAGTVQFSATLFRGALYGEMYRRRSEHRAKPWQLPVQAFSIDDVPPITAPMPVRTSYFMLYLADCLHQAAPDDVDAVVTAPAASTRQKQAFSAIIPQLGACVPEGMTLKLNRMTLEHAFAEYLYRAQPQQTASAVELR